MSQTTNFPGMLASAALRPATEHISPDISERSTEDGASFDAMVSAAWRAGLEAGEHLAAARHRMAALMTLDSLTVDQLAECMTGLSALMDARGAHRTSARPSLRIVQPSETAVN